MGWLTLIAVGFFGATALVIVLARASTARWEWDKRAPVAPRPDVPAQRALPPAAARLPGAGIRGRVAALGSKVPGLAPVTAVARLLPEALHAGASRARQLRRSVHVPESLSMGGRRPGRTERRPRAHPDGGDGTATADPAAMIRFRAVKAIRRNAVDGAERHGFLRSARSPRRRALAFLHRHGDAGDPGAPRAAEEETSAARVEPLHH